MELRGQLPHFSGFQRMGNCPWISVDEIAVPFN